tara:strand:+ start:356 stop:970 length:615 start_codon:yes stop_codon:yes gene_type:complete
MASTTIDIETELSAVNSILGAIGQSPVTAIVNDNPEISYIYNILRDCNVDVQNEGWSFNTEEHVTQTPDANGYITIADNVLRLDVTDGWKDRYTNVVKRNGRLYDKVQHTDVFTNDLYLDFVYLYEFEDLPSVFKRYIVYKASGRAATQLVANADLVKLLLVQENMARANCMEYECNQGNNSIFGFPENTNYTTYQPWRVLNRT